MRFLELLAPAKDKETAFAAINYGADAVYIGAPKFSARAAAGITLEDISELVDFAHIFNVKVYVALNTILFDNEIEDAKKLIHTLYSIGADAIIIQDMGLLECDLPPIQIHASTQMHNTTKEKVEFLEKVGFSQIVLARELSIKKIQEISENVSVPLEFFVHGALCVSYSGQCYMSSFATGRSGNRGVCSQMCRHKYTIKGLSGFEGQEGYFLSLKDLHLQHEVKDLAQAGISSFKIEGRLKDVSYVKNVCLHYRELLDSVILEDTNYAKPSHGIVIKDFNANVHKTFSREFTNYFTLDTQNKVANILTPKSVGEYIGTVLWSKNRIISIQTNQQLLPGDGICFFIDNEMFGTNIEKCSGNEYTISTAFDLKKGTKIWRNFDTSFTKNLQNSKTVRKLEVIVEYLENENGIEFLMKDLYGIEVRLQINQSLDTALNAAKMQEIVIQQLAKTGDTFIKVIQVHAENCTYFFKQSFLNDVRRQLCDLYIIKRKESYGRLEKKITSNTFPFPTETEFTDQRLNCSNTYSEKFYKNHGLAHVEKAFEINKTTDVPLMRTKHCIRYELDICPKHNISVSKATSFCIQDNTGTYKIEFDCKKCEMNIYSAAANKS